MFYNINFQFLNFKERTEIKTFMNNIYFFNELIKSESENKELIKCSLLSIKYINGKSIDIKKENKIDITKLPNNYYKIKGLEFLKYAEKLDNLSYKSKVFELIKIAFKNFEIDDYTKRLDNFLIIEDNEEKKEEEKKNEEKEEEIIKLKKKKKSKLN